MLQHTPALLPIVGFGFENNLRDTDDFGRDLSPDVAVVPVYFLCTVQRDRGLGGNRGVRSASLCQADR